ncbi:unnamed protein product, partial [marine sediment metagenome]
LTALFDEPSLYEITPCCTEGDGKGFEGCYKQADVDLYREHYGSNTKNGSFYALKIVPGDNDEYIFLPSLSPTNNWFERIRGKTVTIGFYAKTRTTGNIRYFMYDGITYIIGALNKLVRSWEWLEFTYTVPTSATSFQTGFKTEHHDINGKTIVYISQAMLIIGPSIGEGNYAPKQGEWVYLDKPIPLNSLNAKTGLSDIGFIDLNIEAESEGMIPKGAKALLIGGSVNDDGSAGADCYLVFRKDATLA